jgi:hypothetical protein
VPCASGRATGSSPCSRPCRRGGASLWRQRFGSTAACATAGPSAGIAVHRDEANYWHLALVEAPKSEGGHRVVELGECLDGRWRAELGGGGRLPLVADDGTDFRWAYGQPYRLRIALQRGRIEGTVTGPGGKLLRRIAWRFDGGVPAVTSGRPALDASLFAGTFDDLHAEVADTVPDPAPEVGPPVP